MGLTEASSDSNYIPTSKLTALLEVKLAIQVKRYQYANHLHQ